VDNLQVKYKALTKAYSVGVVGHFLAIVINKQMGVCICTIFTKKDIRS